MKFFKSHAVTLGYANQILGVCEVHVRLDTWTPKEILLNHVFFGCSTLDCVVQYLEINRLDYEDLMQKKI